MSDLAIQVNGLSEIVAKLGENAAMDAVRTVVRQNGAELQQKMQQETQTAFRKGYSHGDTSRSITLEIEDDGLTAKVAPHTAYAPYLEYGTRFMTAEPFVKPALDKQGKIFIDDMKKLMG